MVQNIREAFIENLETVNWMDSQTKQAAKEKVRSLHNSGKNSLRVFILNFDWMTRQDNFTIVYYGLRKRHSRGKKLGHSNSVTENAL